MSNIHYGKDLSSDIINALSLCSAIVTDENVARLYPQFTRDAIVISAGENSKTPETVLNILARTVGARTVASRQNSRGRRRSRGRRCGACRGVVHARHRVGERSHDVACNGGRGAGRKDRRKLFGH